MKSFLLLLCCLTAKSALAQIASPNAVDYNALQPLAQRVILPAVVIFLLCYFGLAIVKMVLNYLLKRQIVASAVSESVVERLLPGPRDEKDKIVKWLALLFSTGAGLALCNWYLPLGLHSVIILLFSTAFGFLAYYLYLRRQAK